MNNQSLGNLDYDKEYAANKNYQFPVLDLMNLVFV